MVGFALVMRLIRRFALRRLQRRQDLDALAAVGAGYAETRRVLGARP